MEKKKAPFWGIASDVRGRISCYNQDWINGFNSGVGILTPATYIFFASALPAIAFGEQLSQKTGGSLNSVQTLASTAICGVIHSLIGGQPLLILGVAEPTALMYVFFYKFAEGREDLGHHLFLAWTAWICVWAALMLLILAIFNACALIDRFTRVAEELLELLIAALFIQEGIKGIVHEFHVPKVKDINSRAYQFEWRYSNGLLAVIFAFGLLYTALKSKRARTWWCGTSIIRNFIADFGVPLMVVSWSALSYAVPIGVPSGVPRRLFSPNPWHYEALHFWTITKQMGQVPPTYIFGGLIPAAMLTALLFFEHNVAAKLAQQKDFNLNNPSAYHYDVVLLGFMTLLCGLLGLPPCYAVLPHSPLHTKSLAFFKTQLIRKKMVASAKESIRQRASNSEIYGNMQAVFLEMDMNKTRNGVVKELEELKEAVMKAEKEVEDGVEKAIEFDPEKHIERHVPVRVNEQRLTNLIQSLLLAVAVFAMPAIKLMPSSVLWGYFAFMAIDSLPGNQFWNRILLLFVPHHRLHKVLERDHASYMETVPLRCITGFTLFQLVYMLICYGMTWIPLVGILFPLAFFGLIFIRHCILPKYMDPNHLHELDAVEYEEVLATSRRSLGLPSMSFSFRGKLGTPDFGNLEQGMGEDFSDSELLDELTTHRGELKIRTVSFRSERCARSGRKELRPRAISFRDQLDIKVHPDDIV